MNMKRLLCGTALLFMLTSCAAEVVKKPDHMELTKVGFSDLPGWNSDSLAQTAEPLKKSCSRILEKEPMQRMGEDPLLGNVSEWAGVCSKVQTLDCTSEAAVRSFYENNFVPYRVTNNGEPLGLITGYYETDVRASRVKTKEYSEPIYKTPANLTKPYFTRGEIDNGALCGQGLEIAYAKDPVEVFFMQIQGSGRLIFPDGSVQRVGFDNQNGHEYFAIGKALIESGEMTKEEVTAPAIMNWLRSHPSRMREIMHLNKSFVFFREKNGGGPVGAQKVELTPERSLAIDRNFLPFGAPIWLVTETPVTPNYPAVSLQRLMLAQDTGGAIKGPVRGDFFWGNGGEAAEKAGHMKSHGYFFVLIPNGVGNNGLYAFNGR